jgi:thiamine biosynthesis lipoprotein
MRLTFIYLLLLLAACGSQDSDRIKSEDPFMSLQGEVQGTTYSITWKNEVSINVEAGIDSIFREVDQQFSTYLSSSVISQFNTSDSGVYVDANFQRLFAISQEIWQQTSGAFDPTVMPLVRAYGFGPDGIPDSIVGKEQLADLLQLVGLNKLELKEQFLHKPVSSIQLDLNAIAQGHTVDLIADFFEKNEITSYMVEVGGELRLKGKKASGECWKVGIDKPIEQNTQRELEAVLSITDVAMATSGNYRKYIDRDGIRYTHTVDPVSGEMRRHNLLSATVFAPRCAIADAFATAFMVMGVDRAQMLLNQRKDIEALFIYRDEEGKLKSFFTPGVQQFLCE